MLTDHIKHYKADAEQFDYFNVENPAIAEEEKRRMQFLSRKVRFAPGSLVIDCGSGGGWVAKEYIPRDVTVVSVDIADKNLRRIKAEYDPQGKGCYVAADLYHLPFKDGVFDGATSNDVFEHLEKLELSAGETARCLKAGANFYVSVPYKENIVYYICIHCNKPTPINAHLHSFDENGLGKLFGDAGFKIEKIYKFINKGLSITLIFYMFCRWMPFWLWRTVDNIANLFIRKQSRLALKMVRL